MLLNNYAIDSYNPGHSVGGQTNPIMWLKAGSLPMYYGGDAAIAGETDKLGFSPGYLPPYSYALPRTAGGMSSHRNAMLSILQTAALVGGKPGSGTASITFTPTATGGLIVSGSASASIALSANGTVLSIAAATGSATISLSGTALLGALGGVSGLSSITLTPSAAIKAVGYLAGLSTNEAEFSAAALARAVWNAVEDDHTEPGSMAERVKKTLTRLQFLSLK